MPLTSDGVPAGPRPPQQTQGFQAPHGSAGPGCCGGQGAGQGAPVSSPTPCVSTTTAVPATERLHWSFLSCQAKGPGLDVTRLGPSEGAPSAWREGCAPAAAKWERGDRERAICKLDALSRGIWSTPCQWERKVKGGGSQSVNAGRDLRVPGGPSQVAITQMRTLKPRERKLLVQCHAKS